jgi:LuxR family transcriptional regulator, maltose regulon positive regulatory protein
MSGEERTAPILASKLYPACATRSPVPRPRLDSSRDVLEDSYPVVVIVAPAGYGKSTLMTCWHDQLSGRGVPCAWVSMDEDDNDAARFMRHLIAALQHVDAEIGRDVASHLVADFASASKPLLETLAGDIARLQHRLVLFLDDLQFVGEPEVLKILDWLVNYAPRILQIVIGSREEPRLRLGALRVRRQLFELGIHQLQFDAAEAAQFCKSRLGRDLPAQDLRKLLTKTEGWPAALELVAMALADPARQGAFIEHFAGTDSSLVDYLGEVVLSRMDERTRTFVFRISMFDRICAPLAAALGNTDNAEELLQAVRTRNLFLIPLDQSGTWVRFHHLVGEFFRERYRRTAPAEARDCLIRGAYWMHANGNLEDAVNCMIRAQDWEQATKWVAESVEELVFRRGYHQTILRWMNALPEACVDRYPVIRIQYAFALSFYSRHRECEAQLYRLQQLLQSLTAQSQHDTPAIDELRCAVELQTAMATGLRDEGKRGGELAEAWLAGWPQASLRRKGVMGNVLAFGHKTTGTIGRGLEVIGETRKWLEQAEGYYALAWTAYLEAVLHLKQGSYLEARLACHNGLELVERELHGHPAHASLFHALLAGIAYEFDDSGRAIEHIENAMSGVNEYGHADAVIVVYLTQARLQRLRGDEDSALAILREGQELGARRALRRVTLTLAAEECCGLARAGRYEEARLVATRFEFNELPVVSDESDLVSDKAVRAASRYLLRKSPKPVVKALGGAIERSRHLNLAHRLVELLLLRALAQKHDGDWSGAMTDLSDALTIAAPKHYVRVFLDEGRELGTVLERLDPERLRGSEAAPLARRLQLAMVKSDTHSGRQASPIGEEELTKREVSILKRLDSGLSNREIAEAIFVSEGTLKWHLHNVYSKLNVRNRSGAMVRARALGIL